MFGMRFALVSLCLTFMLVPSTLISQAESTIEVARMVLCEGVENREPMNASTDFSPDVSQVYCFTEIKNAPGPTTITHRWFHGEDLMAEVPLMVHGERYRTWSSKQIVPQATGEWRVVVVDESGSSLGEITFRVSAMEETTPVE